MKKISLLILFVMLCACKHESPRLYGTDGNEIPMVFQNFPDIPFPDKSFLSLEDSKIMGNGENWIGSLCFSSKFNAERVFDFFVAEMPKKGWVEIAVVRAQISQMTYVKNGRAVQILIQIEGSDSSFVSITAVPNQASVKTI
jgi:hypothetical protein